MDSCIRPNFVRAQILDLAARIESRAAVDTSHDIPYVAGYSADGDVIFIDRDVPEVLEVADAIYDFYKYLIRHEALEKAALMLKGCSYRHAHRLAIRAEREAVTADGLCWADYHRIARRWIRRIGVKAFSRIPANLDLQPYHDSDDHDLIVRMKACMQPPIVRKQPTWLSRRGGTMPRSGIRRTRASGRSDSAAGSSSRDRRPISTD